MALSILVLPLAAGAEPTVARQLERVSPTSLIYIVNERAPSLSAVARELYGDRRMAVAIARWNGLSQEAWLKPGDRLKIEAEPKYSAAQGTALLIRYWHIAGRHELVARLKALGGESSAPTPVAKAGDWPLKGWPPVKGARLPGFSFPPSQKAQVAAAAPAAHEAHPAVSHALQKSAPPSRAAADGASSHGDYEKVTAGAEASFPVKRRQASVDDEEAGREPKSDGYWLGKDAAALIERIGRKIGFSKPEEKSKPAK